SDRLDQLFRQRPALEAAYEGAVRYIRANGCAEVGLELNWDDWEYPFWFLFSRSRTGLVRLEHVTVPNQSTQFESRLSPFEPCALVRVKGPSATHPEPTVPLAQEIRGSTFSRRWSNADVTPRVDV